MKEIMKNIKKSEVLRLAEQVAYLPGLTMRRVADLHPGQAKTDARDAYIIAETARTMPHTLRGPVRATGYSRPRRAADSCRRSVRW